MTRDTIFYGLASITASCVAGGIAASGGLGLAAAVDAGFALLFAFLSARAYRQ